MNGGFQVTEGDKEETDGRGVHAHGRRVVAGEQDCQAVVPREDRGRGETPGV